MQDDSQSHLSDADFAADDYALDRKTVSAVMDAVDAQDRDTLVALMDPLHPADIADLLEQMDGGTRRAAVSLYDKEFDGDILSELDDGLRQEIISYLRPDVLIEAVRDLESDDVVDLIEDLESENQTAVLDALDDSDRLAVEQSLKYPEYSAGRLMQREIVMAPEHWNVGQAIDFLRNSDELPEQFYHVVLVDPRMHPVANVTLGKLMSSKRSVPLVDLSEDIFKVIPVNQDWSEIAYAFNQYHLISAPVIDELDRLVGIITIDDAMTVMDEEHEEDILRLAGVGEESSLSDSVIRTTRQRLPWLAVNLVTAILASIVISLFEVTIQQFVALAVLRPIVASMGGNAGAQSLTVAVRAIATKDLTGSNVWRVIRREILVGAINGAVFAILMGIVGLIWFDSLVLAYVIAVAMVVNLVVAGLAGTSIPIVLEKLNIDPALASGAFVTTVTDVVGFFAFLGLAGWWLL